MNLSPRPAGLAPEGIESNSVVPYFQDPAIPLRNEPDADDRILGPGGKRVVEGVGDGLV
jgi:hypothetical protein